MPQSFNDRFLGNDGTTAVPGGGPGPEAATVGSGLNQAPPGVQKDDGTENYRADYSTNGPGGAASVPGGKSQKPPAVDSFTDNSV